MTIVLIFIFDTCLTWRHWRSVGNVAYDGRLGLAGTEEMLGEISSDIVFVFWIFSRLTSVKFNFRVFGEILKSEFFKIFPGE
ncbi:hypothetical protein A9R05_15785 [Burkholderia sp. KK1]|nr:hypothetical protein A9R05_15785 [Burkholderia sp. KK1]